MSLGAYEITVADGITVDPTWPEVTYQELLRIGYRDRMIATLQHAVIKRLRGLT
jgi:hypothetical protein